MKHNSTKRKNLVFICFLCLIAGYSLNKFNESPINYGQLDQNLVLLPFPENLKKQIIFDQVSAKDDWYLVKIYELKNLCAYFTKPVKLIEIDGNLKVGVDLTDVRIFLDFLNFFYSGNHPKMISEYNFVAASQHKGIEPCH